MRSRSFSRISQVGAVLFAAGFTVTACVGTDGGSERDTTETQVLVQTDEGLETAAGAAESPPSETVSEEPTPVDERPAETDDTQEAEAVTERDEPTVEGSPLDYGPVASSELVIVGVEADDVLNFRTDPSPRAAIVTTRGSLAETTIVALGEAWQIEGGGVWWLVSVDGEEAWANQGFLSMVGASSDLTAELAAELSTMHYDTPIDAALAVANARASTDPVSTITMVNEPVLSALGGVAIVDVVGLGDDSVEGYRFVITVAPIFNEMSGDEGTQQLVGVRIAGVEAQPLCSRGVSDGLCI